MAQDRFSRQQKIGWWNQLKIGNINAMVVGCGGIGTWTAMQLTFIGVRKLILVDMDTVSESNLNRQFFFEKEIGNLKVDALASKIKSVNSKIKVDCYTQPVESLGKDTFQGVNVIFDCLDNIPTREFLEKLCIERKIPLLHSACSDVVGEVSLITHDNKTRMEYPQNMKEVQKKASCNDFDAAVCTTNMMVASLQVDKFLDYLLKGDKHTRITYIRGKGISYK